MQQHCWAQILWYWGFSGLCSIHITEAFHYTKTFTSNEAGMPQRRKECHRSCGDFSYPSVCHFPLFSSPLLGDICSLMIMTFISACVALCHPDSSTRVRSLGCVQLWNEWIMMDSDSFTHVWHMLPGFDCIQHAVWADFHRSLKNTQSLQGYPTHTQIYTHLCTTSMFNSLLKACEAVIMIHGFLFSLLLPSAFSPSPPYPPSSPL